MYTKFLSFLFFVFLFHYLRSFDKLLSSSLFFFSIIFPSVILLFLLTSVTKQYLNILRHYAFFLLSTDSSHLMGSFKMAIDCFCFTEILRHFSVLGLTSLMRADDFIHAGKMRINPMPLRSRTVRGRLTKEHLCRVDCRDVEALSHISQSYFRSHEA